MDVSSDNFGSMGPWGALGVKQLPGPPSSLNLVEVRGWWSPSLHRELESSWLGDTALRDTNLCSHVFVAVVGVCSPQGSPCHRDREVELGCPTEIRHVWGYQRKGSRKRN